MKLFETDSVMTFSVNTTSVHAARMGAPLQNLITRACFSVGALIRLSNHLAV